jgi:Ca-activated chloride channel family protein
LSFGHPILLIALLGVPLAIGGWLWLERQRHARAAAWSSPELLPNMVPGAPGRRRYVPFAFFLIGLTLLLVGFARPEATVSVPREGATIVLALDVSGSMGATDVKPSRLAAADAAITQFLTDLPAKYRTAFVVFSVRPTVKVPPTYNRQLIVNALPTKAEFSGTALGDGVATSALVASKAVGKGKPGAPHPPAAVLLLSDGLQNTGTLKALDGAAEARKVGVPVYTVSLGTPKGSVVQKVPGPGGITKKTAVPVKSAELQGIARTTGGRFFAATSADELKQVYKDLGHRLATEHKRREITAWTTGGALGFILAGALFSGLWFRRLV